MWRILGLILWLGLFCGFSPERVAWSPDGARAAVIEEDGLHLCDGEGNDSGVLVKGARYVEWMADSKRLVVVRDREFKTWKEVEKAFPWKVEMLKELSKVMREEVQHSSFEGEHLLHMLWDRAAESSGDPLGKSGFTTRMKMALLHLRDTAEKDVKAKLGEAWKEIEKEVVTARAVQLYEVAGREARGGEVLLWWPQDTIGKSWEIGITGVRVSPTGNAVAVMVEEAEGHEVMVASADGKGLLAQTEACGFPDWSPDGRSLVYTRPDRRSEGNEFPSEVRLGALVRMTVFDGAGKAVKVPEKEELADVVYEPDTKVRVLRDGRILFSSAETTFPSGVGKARGVTRLYEISEKEGKPKRVLTADAVKEASLWEERFVVSPDGLRVAIPDFEGRVAIVELSTGKGEVVQDKAMNDVGDEVWSPAWRGSGELTFQRPRGDGKGCELVRYLVKEKKAVVIGGAWGEAVLKRSLERERGEK